MVKGSHLETTLTRRTNRHRSARSEAKPICIWIKGMQRQEFVYSFAQCCLVNLKACDRRQTTDQFREWKRERALCTFLFWMSTMASEKHHHLLWKPKTQNISYDFFFLFFSKTTWLQHGDWERKCTEAWKQNETRQTAYCFLTRADYGRPCSFLCSTLLFFSRFSVCVIFSFHHHLPL